MPGVVAAAVVFAGLLGIDSLHRRFRGESGIGFGDTKLVTAMALSLPLVSFLVALALASGTGIPLALWWRRRTGRERFPFGINLVCAWWLALLVPPALTSVT
jgi:leader peptidase (prepilin peptidase)/N-methyltransferase